MNRFRPSAWMIAAGVSLVAIAGYRVARPRLAAPRAMLQPGRPGPTAPRRSSSLRRVLSILGVALSLTLVTSSAVSASPLAWTTICHHVVQPRETIYCIARAYGVSPSAIVSHNGISNPNWITSGQVLAIPDAYTSLPSGPSCPRQCGPYTPACSCTTTHTVARGESLYRIGVRYGVSMWRIAECNRITNLNLIHTGTVLCIPAP
jgi:LysM repeat protein